MQRKKSFKIIQKGRPPTGTRRRIRPPSARVSSGTGIMSDFESGQVKKKNEKSIDGSSKHGSSYMHRSFKSKCKNNNKKIVPITISTIGSSSQSLMARSVANINKEAASDYNERYIQTPYDYEAITSEIHNSIMHRSKTGGMSQPVLNMKPIAQKGAVKAVNLFAPLVKDTISASETLERSAVSHPAFTYKETMNNNKSRAGYL
jgi:hypothetical protein